MSSLTKNYNNTTYVDFLLDTSFVKADFYDADHLNDKGAKKLTIKLESLIKN